MQYTLDTATSNLAQFFALSKAELQDILTALTVSSNPYQKFFFFRSLSLNRNIQPQKLNFAPAAAKAILLGYYKEHLAFNVETGFLPYGTAARFARKYTAKSYSLPTWMSSLQTVSYVNHCLFPIYTPRLNEGEIGGALYASYLQKNPNYLMGKNETDRLLHWFKRDPFFPLTLRTFVSLHQPSHSTDLCRNIRQTPDSLPFLRSKLDGGITKKMKASFKKFGLLPPTSDPLYPLGFDYMAASMGYIADLQPIELWFGS